jgi:hypothetical protein
VATTIPLPGTGSGWINLVSKLRAGLDANASRTGHGIARAALAFVPYFRKVRLVITAAILADDIAVATRNL